DWLSAKWAEFTTGFGQFYNTWIRPVLELFSLGWDLAGQAVGVALDWITTKWSEFTTMLGTLWTTYGQPVFSVIQTGAQALGTFLATVWDVAKSGFQLFAGTLAAVWSGVISVVWENIKAGAKIVGTVLSGAWEVVKAGFSALGAIFRSVFDNLIRPVFDLLRNIAGIAADFLTGNFGNIRNRFSEMGEAIQRIVMGPITVAMDAMKAAVRLAGAAWDAFSGTVGKVVGIVRDRVSDMVRVIGEIPGRIRNFFADAGRWLLDAGKNIVGGLIDGIRSMAGSIGSAIADIMPDFGFGGFSFSGGGIAAYARGGIAEAERYANGDVRNGHRPQIARAGSWRVWAEDETGGEGYIPLRNDHRRPRAEAIVADIAQRFGGYFARPDGSPWAPRYSGNLVGGRAFAEGGVTERQALDWVHGKTVAGVRPPMGRSLEGSSYVWGGGSAGNWGDCSGMISLVAGFIRGMWNGGKALRRLFATGSQGPTLRQMGFNLGRKTGPGIFSTGWFNGGPYGGHTAGQIGSTRIEMGGGRGNGQINGRAAGTAHPSFTHHAWIKLKDAAATTFASAVSGSSVDGIPTGGASGPAAAPQTAWGKAQELYTQAAAYMGVSDKAPTISTGGTDTRDPVTPSPDGVPQGDDKPKTSGWGHAHFVSQAVKAVKDRRLPERAAQILAATMFVEAGNPVRKWANRSVPESLAFRHDAVGSDHDSVGDQQQRAPWGPVATRMDSYRSAGLFLDRLVKFNWQAMDPGAAAQKVQVSAHPDRYGQQMAAAAKAVKTTGLYDQGGVLPHGGLALNLSRKPEAILTNAQWGDFELLVRHLGDLVPLLADMAVTGELKANPWIKADSPWAQAAAGVHAWGQQVQDTVHRLGEDAATVGMTLGGAWLGQAEIVRDAERGLAETREQVATELAALSEGETDTEKAREVTDQATRKLAAAERTVAAARVTAVAQLVKTVGDEVGKAAGAVGEFVSSLGKIGAQVDKLRQDVAKLGVEQITTRVGAITAAQGLRVAELDLERTRFAGMVAIARAEDTLTQAQRGHLTMNAASISNLGSLTDRFRVAGVAAMDDLAMSYVVNTGEVAEAEWALRLVRAEAELDQREATWKQTKAAFDLQQATALQVYTAEMQSLVSAQLAAQTEAVMGMSQQAAGGFGAWAQGAQQGAGGLFGLLGNVASGVANFMTGNWAGVAMNVVGGIKNVGDMFAGGNKMKANKDDAEEAMKKMDPSMKFGLVLSLLGGAAATGIGVAGSFAGFGPDAVGWGTQIGSQITQSGLGAITQILTDNTDAVNRRFEAQIEALKRDRDMDQALAGASRAGEEARIAAERASLEAEKAAAQARIEEAKAVRAEESPTVLAALRAQAEAMEARRDRLTAAVDTDRAALDAATAALGPREVVVNISGDAVSTDTLEQTLEEILGQIGGVSVRVNRLETAGRGGLGYMTARR
ncbi:MAG: hypothetical protein Q4F65_12105, partial [Propionibacteriaceae bacterium]|nr:hypothetical protein [Propionibacteriaceae bacterium]